MIGITGMKYPVDTENRYDWYKRYNSGFKQIKILNIRENRYARDGIFGTYR